MKIDLDSSYCSLLTQVWHFIIHLRWHYQLLILSGGYLLGGLYSDAINWNSYLIQLMNVHLLLFGGATAYNSYWDKDEGPVGGLKNPPPMKRWMWFASILVQGIGLLLAIPAGNLFLAVYAISMLLFWLYSSPLFRWKSTPLKSIFAIGISTGTNSLLMGYLAAGNAGFDIMVLVCALGVAFILLSLYPISQIFQLEEDKRRGDETFAVRYGVKAVIKFYTTSFSLGSILISLTLTFKHLWFGAVFFGVSFLSGLWIRRLLESLSVTEKDYETVMKIKYGTSLSFVLFLVASLILKHTNLGTVIF